MASHNYWTSYALWTGWQNHIFAMRRLIAKHLNVNWSNCCFLLHSPSTVSLCMLRICKVLRKPRKKLEYVQNSSVTWRGWGRGQTQIKACHGSKALNFISFLRCINRTLKKIHTFEINWLIFIHVPLWLLWDFLSTAMSCINNKAFLSTKQLSHLTEFKSLSLLHLFDIVLITNCKKAPSHKDSIWVWLRMLLLNLSTLSTTWASRITSS